MRVGLSQLLEHFESGSRLFFARDYSIKIKFYLLMFARPASIKKLDRSLFPILKYSLTYLVRPVILENHTVQNYHM